jgi:hypothetical protein
LKEIRIPAWPSWGEKVVAGFVGGALIMIQAPEARAQSAADKAAPPAAAAVSNADLAAAKRDYAAGEKKFKAGDFAGALADFREANDIKSTPHAERYIGLCEDALGHYSVAADWYDRFLAHVPDKMAAQGDEIRKRQAEIRVMPGKVHVDSNPPGADVAIDDKLQPGPTPFDVELAAGEHRIGFRQAGRLPAEKTVNVAFASSQAVSVDLAVEPPPAPQPPVIAPEPAASPPSVPPPSEPRSAVPAYVTGALAIAAAGVGTAFGIVALNDKADFDRNPTTHTADNGDTHSLVADMSFGIAITLGVTSIVLFATKDEAAPVARTGSSKAVAIRRPDAKKAAVSWTAAPFVGAHSGGAGFVVRF